MNPRVLVVDDEKNIRRMLSMILTGAGYTVSEAGSGEEALGQLERSPVEVVMLDVGLPGMDGLETLKQIRSACPGTSVIMISGQATVQVAVDATRLGAFNFLEKPLSKEHVLIAVRNASRVASLAETVDEIERRTVKRHAMVGSSAAMETIRAHIDKVGPTAATVLITGESGSGKEIVARALHDASTRGSGPFIKVNCAAIPEELIESELFGCVRGAYTGADRSRDGKFLQADQGTLFLDEIGDMSLKVQAKVLRALQEGEIERVGDSKTQHVDVRVLAATNKDLAHEVEAGGFREDLFFRLNVIPLLVPPLRSRPSDIAELAHHFLELYAIENDQPPKELTDDAQRTLAALPWRGNVRELRNILERLAILSPGPMIEASDVTTLAPLSALGAPESDGSGNASSPPAVLHAGAETAHGTGAAWRPDGWTVPSLAEIESLGGLVEARREFERRLISLCLDESRGNVSQAARWLAIERSNLHKKIQSLGLETRPPRPGATTENTS